MRPTIETETIANFLSQRKGQVIPLRLTFADKSTKTVRLFIAEGHIGQLPKGKNKTAQPFSPDKLITSFAEVCQVKKAL